MTATWSWRCYTPEGIEIMVHIACMHELMMLWTIIPIPLGGLKVLFLLTSASVVNPQDYAVYTTRGYNLPQPGASTPSSIVLHLICDSGSLLPPPHLPKSVVNLTYPWLLVTQYSKVVYSSFYSYSIQEHTNNHGAPWTNSILHGRGCYQHESWG